VAPGSSFSRNARSPADAASAELFDFARLHQLSWPRALSEPCSAEVKGDLNAAIRGQTDGFGYILASAAVAF